MNNQTQVIEMLKKEVKTNKALDATLHLWAMRKRTRNQLTLSTLAQKLKKEHYGFSKDELCEVLEVLAKSGVGRLETDKKGRPRAIKDIKLTLQSLGHSALTAAEPELKRFVPKNRYSSVKLAPPLAEPSPLKYPVTLQTEIGGKVVLIPIPSNLTAEDVAYLVKKFQENT